jgi:hypothetical protein
MIDALLDERTADDLLSGEVDRGSLSPELQRVSRLLAVVRSPAVANELAGEDAMVDAMLDVIGTSHSRVNVEVQRNRRAKRRTAIAVAAVALVALASTAAAVTNRLPAAVQTTIADAGSHIGIHLPKPDDDKTSDPESDDESNAPAVDAGTDSSSGQGPDATGSAKDGLCTEHFARGTSPSEHAGGVAEQNLDAAAAAAGQTVDEFCADVVKQEPSGALGDASDDTTSSDEPSTNDDTPKGNKPDDAGPPAEDSNANSHSSNGKNPGKGQGSTASS